MLIDSHAHLDMEDFDADRDLVVQKAIQGGVGRIVTVGVDMESSLKAVEIARQYPAVYAGVGYHPHHAEKADEKALEKLRTLASESKVVAWGEIGLDFFRRHSPPDRQVEAFERQLDIAFDLDLPVIIHDREAHNKLLELLRKTKRSYRGVIHCFSGNYDLAMALIEMGFYISFAGTVTYRNAPGILSVASRIPIERLLVETDCPYLAPVPVRGKRNEPLYVTYTAEQVARARGMQFQALADAASANTLRLFGLEENP